MSKRLLLVEDEEDIRRVAEVSLTVVGKFELVMVSSGEEALAKVNDGKFDAIVLDVRLPGMDGPTLLSRLRELDATRDTPIIFLTANIQRKDVARFMTLGIAGLIAKPFDPMTLASRIRELLGWGA